MNLKEKLKSLKPEVYNKEWVVYTLEKSASLGDERITLGEMSFDQTTIDWLRSEGLKVEKVDDQRDGGYIEISW